MSKTQETAWAVKIRASADDDWGWAGEERGEGFRAVFFGVWWARALCGTREDAELLAGDWCGLDAQHEAKLVKVTHGPRDEEVVTLDHHLATVAMVRRAALEEVST